MAQTSISGFYPVKKRPKGEHASVKRRKLTNTTRLDIPVGIGSSDPSSIPVTELTKVRVSVPSNSRVSQSNRGKRKTKSASKKKEVGSRNLSSIISLFDSIAHSSKQSLLETTLPTEPSAKTSKDVGCSPSLSKAPPSLHKAQPPPSSVVNALLPSSPVASRAHTRGAALVELARQRMGDKIPSEELGEGPLKTLGVRRKVLVGSSSPCPSLQEGSSSILHAKSPHKVFKPSARELALPTQHELRGESRIEGRGKGGPTLTHFKSIKIDSPKKECPS